MLGVQAKPDGTRQSAIVRNMKKHTKNSNKKQNKTKQNNEGVIFLQFVRCMI